MKTSIETGKLFGIRKTIGADKKTTTRPDDTASWLNIEIMEKARLEAEHRKAEAITILRTHAMIR